MLFRSAEGALQFQGFGGEGAGGFNAAGAFRAQTGAAFYFSHRLYDSHADFKWFLGVGAGSGFVSETAQRSRNEDRAVGVSLFVML